MLLETHNFGQPPAVIRQAVAGHVFPKMKFKKVSRRPTQRTSLASVEDPQDPPLLSRDSDPEEDESSALDNRQDVRQTLEKRLKNRKRPAGVDINDLSSRKKDRPDAIPKEDPLTVSTKVGFATASSAMDSTKFLNAYIDEEIKRRRGTFQNQEQVNQRAEDKARRDHLFQVPDHLKVESAQIKEGGLQHSEIMLTSIPEVDLGIEERLKAAERAERARRHGLKQKSKIASDQELAQIGELNSMNRFHHPKDLGLTAEQVMQDLFGYRRLTSQQQMLTMGSFDPTQNTRHR